MAMRFYLMPITGAGVKGDPRRPKYTRTDLAGFDIDVMDAGNETPCLCAADVPDATHAILVAYADVTAVPADIDQQIGGSLTAVQAALESFHVPAGWITATLTYRSVLRTVMALFQFWQRYQALGGASPFGTGVTLATTFGSLPAAARTALISTAQSLGYATDSLSAGSTLRQCLKAMADQWRAVDTINLGGQQF